MSCRLLGLAVAFALCTLACAQGRQLLPGDSLKITCANLPALCVIRTIDATGVVWLPGLGNVVAVYMDRGRFEQRLGMLLSSKYGRKMRVGVEAYTFPQDPVRVEGYIQSPISRKWIPGLTIRALLEDVKVREDGDAGHVTIIQPNGRTVQVDVGNSDSPLMPGDFIEVGPSKGAEMIAVLGPVAKPGAYPVSAGLTLAKSIELAGGLLGHADPTRITLHHADGTEQTVDLKKDGGMVLKRGDRVGIGLTQSRLFVSVSGRVAHPGLVEFRPGMTLTQAIVAAGGVPAKSGDVVAITRILDKRMRTTKYHLVRILAKMDRDPILQPADSILLGGR